MIDCGEVCFVGFSKVIIGWFVSVFLLLGVEFVGFGLVFLGSWMFYVVNVWFYL